MRFNTPEPKFREHAEAIAATRQRESAAMTSIANAPKLNAARNEDALAPCLSGGSRNGAAPCYAHPMGNFSINHYSKLNIGQNAVQIKYVIDMAEIPTFQAMRESNLQPDPADPAVSQYLKAQQGKLASGLSLLIDGNPVRLTSRGRRVQFAEGAGGLSTMKIELAFRGEIDASRGARQLVWTDHNFPDRAGWKEIVVVGDGVRLLNSSAPATRQEQ